MIRASICIAFIALSSLASASAGEFTASEFNLYGGSGGSMSNRHGRSTFHSVTFEVMGSSKHLARLLPSTDAGISVSYSDVFQPRSWFGNDGDPYDHVRSEWAYVFARHQFLAQTSGTGFFMELGTGPMWGNRRIPAATSRFNMHSQAGFGLVLRQQTRYPIRMIGRFSHASNAGTAARNPGLNIFSWSLGTTLGRMGRR